MKQVSLIALLILTSQLMGCAYGRYMENGANALAEGRYEQARNNFRNAHQEKPNPEALTQWQLAEENYQRWLDQVSDAGKRNDDAGHRGKALIYFAKVLSERSEPFIKPSYTQLLYEFSEAAKFYGQVSYDQALGDSLEAEIEDFYFSANSGNDYVIEFITNEPTIIERDEEHSGDYVIDRRAVKNPDFYHLQEEIDRRSFKITETENTLFHKNRQLRKLEREWDALSTEEQSKDSHQSLSAEIRQTRSRIHDLQHKLDRLCDDQAYAKREFDRTPRWVYEDVYATHFYTVTTRTITWSGEMIYSGPNGTLREPVEVIYEGNYYEEQPLLALAADPWQQPSNDALYTQLQQQARERAINFMNNQVAQYRQNLLIEANQIIDPDAKFDAWVNYGYATSAGVDPDTAGEMRELLRREVGVGGSFNINALLRP